MNIFFKIIIVIFINFSMSSLNLFCHCQQDDLEYHGKNLSNDVDIILVLSQDPEFLSLSLINQARVLRDFRIIVEERIKTLKRTFKSFRI
jgi:hypothetical protein